jgi:hypothetical protein
MLSESTSSAFVLLKLQSIIIIIISYTYQLINRYEELLAIRLGKPFMDKNPRHPSFAPFLCSPLLIYGCRYYHVLYLL